MIFSTRVGPICASTLDLQNTIMFNFSDIKPAKDKINGVANISDAPTCVITLISPPPIHLKYVTYDKYMNGLIERTTTGDVHTIGASYALMVLYIVIALGRVSSWKKFFIEGKLSLSLTGVILVLFSVGASIGMFGFFQVPATLIIFEILPFLVLAVGVDNIFIMVDAHQKMPKLENEPDISHIGRVVGEVAPSMFVSTAAQVSPISYFTKTDRMHNGWRP